MTDDEYVRELEKLNERYYRERLAEERNEKSSDEVLRDRQRPKGMKK